MLPLWKWSLKRCEEGSTIDIPTLCVDHPRQVSAAKQEAGVPPSGDEVGNGDQKSIVVIPWYHGLGWFRLVEVGLG